MTNQDDYFDRIAFQQAMQRGAIMLFDACGVRVLSDDVTCAYRWYALRLGRPLTTDEWPQALRAWILEGRPNA